MTSNPIRGYSYEDVDLTDPDFYMSACEHFGKASMLPTVAYQSKNFSELEDEKLWTRSWVAVGTLMQIPNPGDLLPYTVGNHGIHVERQEDGSLIGRFNKAQHGGCRSIPGQCKTGKKTKCSYTSCGYSRDRDVITADELGDNNPAMHQYIGLVPERLLPVKVETFGPFIFINLDADSLPLKESLTELERQIEGYLQSPFTHCVQSWIESKCNWKLAGRAFIGAPPKAEISCSPVNDETVAKEKSPSREYAWQSSAIDTKKLNFAMNLTLPSLSDQVASETNVRFCWLFPNLLLCLLPTHIVYVVLQPLSMGACLQRVSVLAPEGSDVTRVELLQKYWVDFFSSTVASSEKKQAELDLACSVSNHAALAPLESIEDSYGAYHFQQYLLDKLLYEHKYFMNSPMYMHAD
jgi:hypothetical protein